MTIQDLCKCGAAFSVSFSNHDFAGDAEYRHKAFLDAHAVCRAREHVKESPSDGDSSGAEGDKLYPDGDSSGAEGDKLYPDGDSSGAEGDKGHENRWPHVHSRNWRNFQSSPCTEKIRYVLVVDQ
jgi:hypothetical protein